MREVLAEVAKAGESHVEINYTALKINQANISGKD
jgi:hypothetical protein